LLRRFTPRNDKLINILLKALIFKSGLFILVECLLEKYQAYLLLLAETDRNFTI
jgi:hypothetical protein